MWVTEFKNRSIAKHKLWHHPQTAGNKDPTQDDHWTVALRLPGQAWIVCSQACVLVCVLLRLLLRLAPSSPAPGLSVTIWCMQVHLRHHRLATICLAEANFERAEMLSKDTEKHFTRELGPKHPLTGEAQLCLAVARAKMLDAGIGLSDPFSRVLAPGKRREQVQRADAGLAVMRNGYGSDHMLVEKAATLHKLLQE